MNKFRMKFFVYQIFEEHERLSDRFCKTLYYGQLPTTGDRFSLSMTEICVEKVEFFMDIKNPFDLLILGDMANL
jgi:hypothetical protein